jgi:hypothetical protein
MPTDPDQVINLQCHIKFKEFWKLVEDESISKETAFKIFKGGFVEGALEGGRILHTAFTNEIDLADLNL